MRPFVIGIAGGTASGKSSVCRVAAERLGCPLLGHDRYYRDAPEPRRFNFDHPDALETDLMVRHLQQLRAGEPAELPVYQFGVHRRAAHTERVEPGPLILVEGILVLADPGLRGCFDLSVYVDCPDDIRLIRRLRRDIAERGRTMESVLDQYLATVRPMHERFVAPGRALAGLVLDGTAPVEESVARLIAAIPAGRSPLGS